MPRAPVHHDQVEHLRAGEHRHAALRDLLLQCLVGAQEQLLPRLATRVEGARDLCAAERAVGEQAAVLPRERHALRDALVDDVHADLREAIDVPFSRAEVAALDRVVEQALDAVAIVLVVLRRVDPALRRDRMGSARRVLVAVAAHVVSQLAQRGGGGAPCEPGSDDDDRVFPLVGRVHQLHVEPVPVPLLRQRARRDPGLEVDRHLSNHSK